ncbi:MAG TPA: sugar phosphate isomerase/epimerase family protein [Anaerolineales bacterium]|nr:sugar phosphate isomerase/epimerase family protein [Anaerolineales bacterium]
MDHHWDHYCTMSIVHFMAFPATISGEGSIAESVAKIAEDPFFGGVEITWIKDPAERARVKTILETSRTRVGYGAQPAVLMGKLNPNSLDETERRRAVDALKLRIDEAAELGAKRMAFLSGKDPGDKDRKAAVEALVQSVRELCAYGKTKGVALTMETFDRDVDKKALIGPSELAAEFAAEVRKDHPDFGLMYDLSHQPLLHEESEPALRLLKDHLVHIHVGNCVRVEGLAGYGDLHPRFGWPGASNDIDELVAFLKALFKVGYLREGGAERPWVGFEVKPQTPAETPEQVIAGTKRIWAEAWARA